MSNPLLENYVLPPFSEIKPEHVEPAVTQAISQARQAVDKLLTQVSHPTWETLVEPMEDIDVSIDRVWSPVSHMNSVVNSDELRKAYNACLPMLSEFGTELGQNEDLYRAYKQLAESEAYQSLDTAQKKVIDNAVRDFRLSGVELNQADRDEYKNITQKLTELSAKFEENLMDATHGWKKHVTDKELLSGLPESTIAMAEQFAKRDNVDGWVFTLDFPSYMPVMSYADNREFREEMYTAFATKASDQGPNAGQWDNTQVMADILKLRHRLANLLGFANHAERSLATKMAQSPEQVMDFLTDLAERSKPIAVKEFEELKVFAKETAGMDELQAWDVTYFAEKLRQQRYSISQEELKPYFPEDKVVSGLFAVVNRLYGLVISERTDIDTWHKDVRFFEIRESNGNLRGQFYLDLYARQHKRGGAWMDECLVRRKTAKGLQTPVAFLTCNFSEPVGDKPALFTHDEVTTLFHEFGHGLHHMLTKIDYAGVSGINGVAWDAVELPSQFMENWCWEREALDLISGHYETGEKLPEELYEKMIAARNFQSAMMMVRQLEFSIFDFRLHLEFDPEGGNQVDKILAEVRDQVAVVQPPKFNRFAHSFGHIFAGGYAAGYYSYKWAEVLSADAFSKFEEKGIFDRETGLEFLNNILEQGGSKEPMELFIAFRGREPEIDALLRHSGIAA
ncbi:MAG TPA: oligopeptidase A [Methylophaga aminisulfidivorans]|uniref:oligopeptidase A n=1 Tax=Methylophaga aminisulfidivorans MP TaxID=1026882 RepID=F5T2L4_9GAMM|nr:MULTISPECIES: oligopeptidase A [Methylophaga]EGL53653.1 Zn-dependent oligopeptidase [Methylophaga aminisulfidivorans MP]HIC45821.1 oligopeptidase A [Methylophaga sp.]HIM38615.1 oligopeptidase A [Methylophaga aminisulfidivorans]